MIVFQFWGGDFPFNIMENALLRVSVSPWSTVNYCVLWMAKRQTAFLNSVSATKFNVIFYFTHVRTFKSLNFVKFLVNICVVTSIKFHLVNQPMWICICLRCVTDVCLYASVWGCVRPKCHTHHWLTAAVLTHPTITSTVGSRAGDIIRPHSYSHRGTISPSFSLCCSVWLILFSFCRPPPFTTQLCSPSLTTLSLPSFSFLILILPLFAFPSWLCKWPHFNEAQTWLGHRTAWLEAPFLSLPFSVVGALIHPVVQIWLSFPELIEPTGKSGNSRVTPRIPQQMFDCVP